MWGLVSACDQFFRKVTSSFERHQRDDLGYFHHYDSEISLKWVFSIGTEFSFRAVAMGGRAVLVTTWRSVDDPRTKHER